MDLNEVDNRHSSFESDSSSHSSSENDSSSDLDDSPGEFLLITKLNAYYSRLPKEPCMTSELSGRQFVIELLNGHPDRLFDFAIMNKNTFTNLCSTLKGLDFLQDDRSICVEGMIAEKSRQFNRILKAICQLGTPIIQPPNLDVTPPKIMENPNYHLWFKINDCIGAIDGTHISAWAPTSKQIPYRGKYYLVDSGYANMREFLAPYRGERYHLRDYRGRGRHPREAMELFYYRHSSLRNGIERCFGVLKARFPILKRIPVACCTMHNFIRMQSRNDIIFHQYQANDLQVVDEEHIHLHEDNANEMSDARDHIAEAMDGLYSESLVL
ncbi:hypothetical protein PRUPE_1G096200 [Prunus persica]|uniref:Uncharacterized protein n=1 Tax=Prunus persica TaxID=3760 RepID=A0A251QUU5_PRUPE|nr:hypothetical protein PRUPE_1G096200 [Prunus persica]